MKPHPYTTISKDLKVTIVRKSHYEYSNVQPKHIGKSFLVTGVDYGGRTHNRYICCVYLSSKIHGDIRATIDEIALLNPNLEPDGEFVVCVGCGASMAESELKVLKYLGNIKACLACGMLEPDKS